MNQFSVTRQRFQAPSGTRGSPTRRARLWDIPASCHCPVIGICLPLDVLRRLAGKVLLEPDTVDDYTLHSCAVQGAVKRNPFSEIIQEELEKRYAIEIKRFRGIRDREALALAWGEAVSQGQIAGALWALVTHPLCDEAMSEALSQQLHMLQHQAGAGMHLDLARYHAALDENTTLTRALAKAQQRCELIQQEKSARIEALEAELIQQRGEVVRRDFELAQLRAELANVAAPPQPAAARRLEQQLRYQQQRSAQLALENARLAKALARLEAAQPPAPTPVAACAAQAAGEGEASLSGHRILCVGGRDGAVVTYRRLIEQAGGAFLHHDGGVGDRFAQLDCALAAADLVICQTGCISHNAYWRVKDHCKRTGKRCAFVETPSAAGLARGLRRLLTDALVESQSAVQNASAGGSMTVGLEQT